jgi:hypothetical protein
MRRSPTVACFACSEFVRVHGAKFQDLEPAILNAGTRLVEKQRAGRLEELDNLDQDCGDREDHANRR